MNALKRALTTVLFIALAGQTKLIAQKSLSAAKDLYAAAAYEEALTVLDGLRNSADHASQDSRDIEQYRAFCLLALGRKGDAEHAIEGVVAAEPMYQPGEAEASPRVRAAFADVRRRMLPSIAQQKYVSAKATFDRKEFSAAAAGFKAALDVMDDPALDTAKEPALADLRMLANGFFELSVAAATPPAPEPEPAEPEPALPAAPVGPWVYSASDTGVVPPTPLKQGFPKWPKTAVSAGAMGRGVLELVVDEKGAVETAVIRQSVSSVFDRLLLTATKSWKYKPATNDGQPVKYRKLLQVTLEGR